MFPSFHPTDNSEIAQNFKMNDGYQKISQRIANALIETTDNVNILDVRTDEEFITGHLENAYNYSSDLIYTYRQLPFELDKEKPLIIYCRSGSRTSEIGPILANMGFKYVLDMGGVVTWKYGLVN